MITKYKLLKEYPGHTIGDIAVYTIMPEGKGHNTFQWENGTGIPLEFFPGITRTWWEKIENEKSLEDYKNIFQNKLEDYKNNLQKHTVGKTLLVESTGNNNWHSLMYCFPNIYWTEILRIIAEDLNANKTDAHHEVFIVKDDGGYTITTLSRTYRQQGLIYFRKHSDCQKAIDLLGENIKYLFND